MEEQKNRFSGMSRAELEKEARKQIVHSGLLALAALVVIIVACYAWLCSAGSVSAEGMRARLAPYGFDLASVGQVAQLEETLPEDYQVPEGADYPAQTGWKWTMGGQTIQWRMEEDANLGNLPDEDNLTKGIRPGLSGKVRFYVIPREDGPLTIRFAMDVLPMTVAGKNGERLAKLNTPAGDLAVQLLRGHLLFAFSIGNNGQQKTLASYLDGTCTLDFGTVTADDPILVTVDWFWPETWEAASTWPDFGARIANWAQDTPDSFFYTDPEGSGESSEEKYNDADKYIGDQIDAIALKLSGDTVS